MTRRGTDWDDDKTTPESPLMITASPLGSLAAELEASERLLLDAQHRLEVVLDSVYGADGWQDYEHHECTLDVYGVTPAPAAVDALHRAGFSIVYEHQHEKRSFKQCACRAR